MRIVGGELRGRLVKTPSGAETRPTSDRAREAVFNILEHAAWSPGIEGSRIIDLFAGSGAMGLEALSRGAGACLFVERTEAALACIRANVEAFGLGPRTRLLRQDATRLARRLDDEAPFDLALLDPPYGQGLGETALMALHAGGWFAEGAVVVLERGADEGPLTLPGFGLIDERRYGAASVAFLSPSAP